MKNIAVKVINIYKSNSVGFWLGSPFVLYSNCKYHPTCSEYTVQAIEKHGLLKGFVMGIWRILRCNPFSKGGVDPVVDFSNIRQRRIKAEGNRKIHYGVDLP